MGVDPPPDIPRVDDAQVPVDDIFCLQSPKSAPLPAVAMVIYCISAVGDGTSYPPKNTPLPHPPLCSVGPLGILIAPVEDTVVTPANTVPC